MKIAHHRLIGLNTLIVIEKIKEDNLPIPENIKIENVLTLLGRDQKNIAKSSKII